MARNAIYAECFARIGDGPIPASGPQWLDGDIVIVKTMDDAERAWAQMLARGRVRQEDYNKARLPSGAFTWPWTELEQRHGFISSMEIDPRELGELVGPAYSNAIPDWNDVVVDEPIVALARARMTPEEAETEGAREKLTRGELDALRDPAVVVEPVRTRLIDPESIFLKRTATRFRKRQ